MRPGQKKALVIAPHQDDEIIGCGGSIAFLKEKGFDVGIVHVFLGSTGIKNAHGKESHRQRHQEALLSAELINYRLFPNLGFEDRQRCDYTQIQLRLLETIRGFGPNIIFIPHKNDQDAEHQIVFKSGWEASWLASTPNFPHLGTPINKVAGVFCYEVWTPIQEPSLYIDITPYKDIKKKALKMFKTQMNNTSWIDGALGLNRYRGATLQGKGLAEAFLLKSSNLEDLVSIF